MASFKHREIQRELREIADSLGAVAVFERTNGGHRRVVLSRNNQSRFIIYADSSRSTRGLRATMALARRTIKAME
jgi:hypothetical protein